MQHLESKLDRIDRKGYGAYKELRGSYEFEEYALYIDKVQRDPFAPPSLVRVRTRENRFDPILFENPLRRGAFEDFL
ncbi:MAG: ABC-ATPase domain-containing protein, partial [Rubrobacteraceae bacterium]